jgi:agmatinase
VAKEGVAGMEVVEVSPPYDVSDIIALLAVRAMVDVLATMVKHDRIGGRLVAETERSPEHRAPA